MLEYLHMPRARLLSETEASVDVPKKRAPRKRVAATADVEEVTSRPRAPRRRTVKVTVEEPVCEREPEVVAQRRAPTPLAIERKQASRSRRSILVALVLFFGIAGIGVAIGMSDQGQIDVVAVVNERNERINRGEVREGESTITVPVQNTDVRPNGGLIPADPSAVPPPSIEVPSVPEATSTATTTLDQEPASTTDEKDAAADTPLPAEST